MLIILILTHFWVIDKSDQTKYASRNCFPKACQDENHIFTVITAWIWERTWYCNIGIFYNIFFLSNGTWSDVI
jgi:hypothetical protein